MEADGRTALAGRYALGELLGRGGMGEVRAGEDVRLGRAVAVKLLREDLAKQADVRRRFEVEARAAAGIAHPNVVTVYDSGEEDGQPFIVMERLPGRTLADELVDGPLRPERVSAVGIQVAAALAAAHEQGVLHRDLKPANLLVCPDGTIKVADFGIAKTVGDDLTRTGELVGTVAYLAPERVRGLPATVRSDVYALGTVLYQALSGRKPYDADTPAGVMSSVVEGRHVPLADLCPDASPALVASIERAMAVEPDDRFGSAVDVLAALASPAATAATAARDRPTERQVPLRDATVALDERAARAAAAAGGGWGVEQRAEPRPVARRIRLWRPQLIAVAALVVVALGVAALRHGTGSATPPETTTTSAPATAPGSAPVADPLAKALDDLDKAVRP